MFAALFKFCILIPVHLRGIEEVHFDFPRFSVRFFQIFLAVLLVESVALVAPRNCPESDFGYREIFVSVDGF